MPLLKIRFQTLLGPKVYDSYQEALKSCGSLGYENDIIPQTVLKKTKIFKKQLSQKKVGPDQVAVLLETAILQFIADEKKPLSRAIRVLDFGGACGAHYFAVRQLLPNNYKLNWQVIETPIMCEYGSCLANKELSFSSNLSDLEEDFDIVHTSGSLQPLPEPAATLQELIDLKAPRMLFNRLGLVDSKEDLVTIHKSLLSWNGMGPLPKGIKDRVISYPFTFMSKNIFDEKLSTDYKLIGKFEDESGCYQVKKASIVGGAMLYKRNS